MRAYHDLLLHLKEVFEDDDFVNTITSDGFIDMDNYRKTVYPIVDFYINSAPFTLTNTSEAVFSVEVTCLDIRDWNKEEVIDKLYWNDNRHDNWNLTYAILKTAFNKLKRGFNDSEITLTASTDAERIQLGKKNGLDGWQVTWTFSVPDINTTRC